MNIAANIDFGADAAFSSYVLLLLGSGVLLLLAAAGSRGGLRIANVVFGAGFVAYGFYLAFVFDGGTYLIFFKAFLAPALLLFRTVRAWGSRVDPAPVPDATTPAAPSGPAQDGAQGPTVEVPAQPRPATVRERLRELDRRVIG